jgi:hypothetical protein
MHPQERIGSCCWSPRLPDNNSSEEQKQGFSTKNRVVVLLENAQTFVRNQCFVEEKTEIFQKIGFFSSFRDSSVDGFERRRKTHIFSKNHSPFFFQTDANVSQLQKKKQSSRLLLLLLKHHWKKGRGIGAPTKYSKDFLRKRVKLVSINVINLKKN